MKYHTRFSVGVTAAQLQRTNFLRHIAFPFTFSCCQFFLFFFTPVLLFAVYYVIYSIAKYVVTKTRKYMYRNKKINNNNKRIRVQKDKEMNNEHEDVRFFGKGMECSKGKEFFKRKNRDGFRFRKSMFRIGVHTRSFQISLSLLKNVTCLARTLQQGSFVMNILTGFEISTM